jgi:hypothetical protein
VVCRNETPLIAKQVGSWTDRRELASLSPSVFFQIRNYKETKDLNAQYSGRHEGTVWSLASCNLCLPIPIFTLSRHEYCIVLPLHYHLSQYIDTNSNIWLILTSDTTGMHVCIIEHFDIHVVPRIGPARTNFFFFFLMQEIYSSRPVTFPS